MKSNQFTPGPWEVHMWTGHVVGPVPDPGRCHPVICHPTETFECGEMEANARLIAAAPDLLAQCQRLLSLFDSAAGTNHRGEITQTPEGIAMLRAAIAKAQGCEVAA